MKGKCCLFLHFALSITSIAEYVLGSCNMFISFKTTVCACIRPRILIQMLPLDHSTQLTYTIATPCKQPLAVFCMQKHKVQERFLRTQARIMKSTAVYNKRQSWTRYHPFGFVSLVDLFWFFECEFDYLIIWLVGGICWSVGIWSFGRFDLWLIGAGIDLNLLINLIYIWIVLELI